MPEYEGKYIFVSNTRTTSAGVVPAIFVYNTAREAEIKYHDEVSYALQLNDVVLAHYKVVNEYGVVYGNLETTIDNQEPVEA